VACLLPEAVGLKEGGAIQDRLRRSNGSLQSALGCD
jgi:hypothetical protein